MKRAALVVIPFFILAGCGGAKSFADLDCSDVADSAVSISNGALVTLDDRSLTSRDEKHVVCHGTGGFADGTVRLVRFQAFINDNGQEVIRYDTDEFQATQEAKEKQDEQRQEQEAEQGLERDYAQFQAQVRSATTGDGS